MEKYQKKPREREANWGAAEKEFLRECVQMHIDIVEHKGNDTSMILKKKYAWKTIRDNMASAGYDREIPKLKAQWVRMKVSARKAVANIKRATGNFMEIPEISKEDNLVQSMIINEFEEDEILIDSNCIDIPIDEEFIDSELLNNSTKNQQDFVIGVDSLSEHNFVGAAQKNKENSSHTKTPLKVYDDLKKRKFSPVSKLQRLKNLPKRPSKHNIILERQRQRQIAKETLHFEEVSKLQRMQMVAEIEQQKELHTLKLQRLQRQIDQDEELHSLKLEILRKTKFK